MGIFHTGLIIFAIVNPIPLGNCETNYWQTFWASMGGWTGVGAGGLVPVHGAAEAGGDGFAICGLKVKKSREQKSNTGTKTAWK